MNNFLTYILEVNIALSLFYAVYILMFRKDANFNTRRAFLLISMIASLIFPALNINFSSTAQGLTLQPIELGEILISAGNSQEARSMNISFFDIFLIVYSTVTLFFFSKLFLNMISIVKAIFKSETYEIEGTNIYDNKTLHASSFFKYIFLSSEQAKDKNIQHILQHEKSHVMFRHSIDRILAEVVICFSWFNPLSWKFRNAVVENHEYQADNKVIEQGTDQISYQLTILNQYIGSATITNQFSNQIKKRINMLNKNHKKGSFWKSIMLIPVSALLVFFVSCNTENDTIATENSEEQVINDTQKNVEEEIFYVVEEMPKWEDGSEMFPNMRSFIAKNLSYPKEAINNGAQGKVFVTFMVNKEGKVIIPDPKMLPPEKANDGSENEVVVVAYRTINEEDAQPDDKYIQMLKDEAIRVLELTPDLIPGMQRGKKVNVLFTMPITFALQ